jgi:hypothetical protein
MEGEVYVYTTTIRHIDNTSKPKKPVQGGYVCRTGRVFKKSLGKYWIHSCSLCQNIQRNTRQETKTAVKTEETATTTTDQTIVGGRCQ